MNNSLFFTDMKLGGLLQRLSIKIKLRNIQGNGIAKKCIYNCETLIKFVE